MDICSVIEMPSGWEPNRSISFKVSIKELPNYHLRWNLQITYKKDKTKKGLSPGSPEKLQFLVMVMKTNFE